MAGAIKLSEHRIHEIFRVSIILKGVQAGLECVAGLALGLVSTNTITSLVVGLSQHRLAEDPDDMVAGTLMRWASGFSIGAKDFYVWYLISHGVVKLVLVGALWANRLWAYPASLVVLGLFVAYQAYRYTIEPSIGLILLSIFDVIVIGLIWHEYRLMRKYLPPTDKAASP